MITNILPRLTKIMNQFSNIPRDPESEDDVFDFYSEAKRSDRQARVVFASLAAVVGMAILFYGMYLAGKI